MRIWYQSGAPLGKDPLWKPYEESLKGHLQRSVRPGTTVDVHGVELDCPVRDRTHYIQYLDTAQWIDNAIAAEKEGYDAFAGGCMLDTGWLQIREVVDIPVTFISQTSLHFACLLGHRFSLLAYEESMLFQIEERVRQYGLWQRYVPANRLGTTPAQLLEGFGDVSKVLEAVKKGARKAIDGGADILVPACNILTMVLVNSGIREIDGVPILDNVGVAAKTAEMLVDLKETGTTRSRKGYHIALSKEDLDRVRQAHGD